jgi:hypothetical protein
MANKITNLRNWINGEVFNARDYTYERNLIVSLVNNHEDRVTALEINNTANTANIAANTANIAANTANIATNTSKITVLEDFANNLDDTYLDKITTSLQTIQGPITFNSKVILNETNLDETFLDKITTDEQSVAGVVDFEQGIKLDGAILEYINTEKNIGLESQITSKFRLKIGQQSVFFGKASGAIAKGDAIQFAGAQGDHFLIKKAVQSEINASPEYFIGIAAQDLSNEEYGFVLEFGPLIGVLKTGLVQGDILWFDSQGSTPGALTKVKPERGFAQIRVAAVINSQNAQLGQWLIRPSILETSNGIQTFLQNTEPDNLQEGDIWFDSGG